MKATTKSSAILLAILATSTLAGTSVLAADSDLTSTGKVTVGEGTDTDGGELPEDPEKDGKLDPEDPDEIDKNEEKGPYKIEHVSKLNFGSVETSTKEVKKFAAPIKVKGDQTRGAAVGFADIRTTAYGYTVQVKMSEQFTGTGGELKGSTITYNKAILRSADDNFNNQPKFTKTNDIKIGENGAAVEVLNASKDAAAAEGKGRFVMEFGQSKDFQQPSDSKQLGGTVEMGTEGAAVELAIPSSTASSMKIGDYTAKVTWLMTAQP